MIKTVDIVGTEVKVEGLGGQNVAVKNLGSGSIYVSTKPNITAGADNVIEIPAGAGEVVLDANGTVYIVGTGKVQCTGTPYAVPNFKLPSTSSGGGGGTSDVTKEYVDAQDTTNLNLAKSYTDNAKSEIQTTIDTVNDTLNTHIADQVKHITAEERAAWNSKAELTDIPTELPANGGNADTVDGLHANEIASNPNLLINPDFLINQRNVSGSITTTGYFVDRWQLVSGTVTINSDGTILLDGTIKQILENYAGDNVTTSASAGTASYDNNTKTFSLSANNVTISWAKLELGTNATPFIPPDPATELAKCQYYYKEMNTFRINMAYYEASYNSISWFIPYKAMRTIPTVTIKNKDLSGTSNGLHLNGIPNESFQPTDYNLKWVACFGKTESGVIRIGCTINSSLKDALNSWWNAPLTANAETAGLILDAEL